MTKLALLVAIISTLSAQPDRVDWRCQNDVEVSCISGPCEAIVAEQHLPSDLLFNFSGDFSLCVGGGCWSGTGNVLATSTFFVISKEKAEWSADTRDDSLDKNLIIVFDPEDEVAVVKVWGLVMPHSCTRGARSNGD